MDVIHAKKANYDELIGSKENVIVDFWASWCGPCRMLGPVLEDIAKSTDILVVKVNVDEEEELAVRFKVNTIPTILIYKNGKIVNQTIGYKSKSDILKLVK